MRTLTLLLAAVVTVAAASAFLLRYEVIAVPGSSEDRGVLYRLDRWTGNVAVAQGKNFLLLKPEPVDPPDTKVPEIAHILVDGLLGVSKERERLLFSAFNGTEYVLTRVVVSVTFDTPTMQRTRLVEIPVGSGGIRPRTQSSEFSTLFPTHDYQKLVTWKIAELYGFKE